MANRGQLAGERPILEREEEIESARAALEAAAAGRGSLIMLEGPAGIGKSRLLAEIWDEAESAGFRVLSACGDSLEAEFPAGIVRRLFVPLVRAAEAAGHDAFFKGPAAPAGALLTGNPAEVSAPGLLHSLFWLVQNLAESRPVLIVVDDLHWVDAQSLRFIAHLARRVAEMPVLLVCATRPSGGQPEAAREMIGRIGSAPGAAGRRLAPLSPAAVDAIVRGAVPAADAAMSATCAAITRGNPFLLHELLAGLDGEEESDLAERVGESAPETVRRSTLGRLSALGPGAPALAAAAAVLGEDAQLRRAAEIAGLDLDEAGELADALVAAEITERSDPLLFCHALVRTATLEEAGGARCAAMALRAAEILRREGEDPQRIAIHLLGARRGGEPWVVEVLLAAGRSAIAAGAPESAVAMLKRALEEPPPSERRSEVLLALGRAEAIAGIEGADRRLSEAAVSSDDPCCAAEAYLLAGRSLFSGGRMAEAAAAFELGAARLAGGIDDELAAVLSASWITAAVWVPERSAEANAAAERIVAADLPGRSQAERMMLSTLGSAKVFAGSDREGAVELARRSWADGALLADGSADDPTIYAVSGVLSLSGHHREAISVLDAALADARARASWLAHATAAYCRGGTLWFSGELREAVADLELAIAARHDGWSAFLPAAYAILFEALFAAGREAELRERIAEAATQEDAWRANNSYPWFLHGKGEALARLGELDAAREHLSRAGELFLAAGLLNPAVGRWRGTLAEVLSRLGERARALALAGEEVERARVWGEPETLGRSLRSLARVDSDSAPELLAEAVERLRAAKAGLHLAEALLDFGATQRRAGRRVEARELIREALELSQSRGAEGIAARAEEELTAAGGKPRRRELTGPGSLTPSELRVARMAASGMSNREIAEQLFVTIKAVQWHLGNSYRKLEIGGRKELASALGEEAGRA